MTGTASCCGREEQENSEKNKPDDLFFSRLFVPERHK